MDGLGGVRSWDGLGERNLINICTVRHILRPSESAMVGCFGFDTNISAERKWTISMFLKLSSCSRPFSVCFRLMLCRALVLWGAGWFISAFGALLWL